MPSARSVRTMSHMSRRSSTSTPAVGSSRNRISGSWLERLGDHHPALHAARQLHHPRLALVPQRQAAEDVLDRLSVPGLAEQAAREGDRAPDRLERIGGQLLRDQPDPAPRVAKILLPVLAVDQHLAAARSDDPADDVDHRRLAGAVRAEQRENLALADVEVDRLERLGAASHRPCVSPRIERIGSLIRRESP